MEITSPIVKELALISIDSINNVKLKNHSKLCMTLSLKSIIRAEAENTFVSDRMLNLTTSANYTHSYTILFEASPSDAIFESRILYDEKTNASRIHSQILRINLYGQSSACIRDVYELRSFCYCLSYHKTLPKGTGKGNPLRRSQRAQSSSTITTGTTTTTTSTQQVLTNSTNPLTTTTTTTQKVSINSTQPAPVRTTVVTKK